MQRRSHNASNGNGVMMTESSTVVEMGGATTTTVQQQQQQRRRRRKKVVRNSGFRTHYRREWEAMLQVSLVVGWFVVALVYCIYHVSSNWALYSPTVHVTGLFGRKMVYNIPHMMSNIGDKSVGYQLLRQEIDALLPENDQRSLDFVESIKKRVYKPIPIPTNDSSSSYNVLNCPDQPPPGYPYAWNILDLLEHWPANDYKNPRSTIHMGVCRFDYRRDYDKIMTYRQQEVPFVVSGDPEVARTVERWNTDGYMQRLMSDVPHRCEYSPNNQFMYWIRPPGMRKRNQGKTNSITTNNNNKKNRKSILAGIEKPENWKEPTTMMRMRFGEWLEKANVTDDKLGPEQPHWYYRLIGCGLLGRCDKGSSEYLYDELTFFQPQEGKIYLIEPRKQKGIHCRFGMKGVTAGKAPIQQKEKEEEEYSFFLVARANY